MDVIVVGLALAVFALALRLAVHVGETPSGVDTWYYLASADALRRRRRLPVRLPQYLLQDAAESYPPVFPILLSLIPRSALRRAFWLVSPVVDAVHLLLLFTVTYVLTGNVGSAALGGLIYALMPQLIAETRSLNPRSLTVLISSVAMLLMLRYTVPPAEAAGLRLGAEPPVAAILAVVAITGLFLASATPAIALGISAATLSVLYGDPRYVAFVLVGFALAFVVTAGFYANVLRNYLHAVRFWARNLRYRSADQIRDSPLYGSAPAQEMRRTPRWRSLRFQALRLVGENPFVVPMALTPLPGNEYWPGRMHWWALSVLAWAALTTFVRPLRVFGPGYIYLKASIFPTAYVLAITTGQRSLISAEGWLVIGAAVLSLAAIAFFIVYTRTRPTERTASVPPELVRITAVLSRLPGDGVLVLPSGYADYVCYESGMRTLWGGHSGDLTRFEQFFPVIRRPLEDLIASYDLHHVLLDRSYVTIEQLRLQPITREVARDGSFTLYDVTAPRRDDQGSAATPRASAPT